MAIFSDASAGTGTYRQIQDTGTVIPHMGLGHTQAQIKYHT